jgi:hypothetical protein
MYKKDDGQITITEFRSPFGELDRENRWVKIAELIPWQEYENKYAERFCDANGAPAIKFRMAMGTLIIKQRTGHSDDEVLRNVVENPYMQYLIGLHEFTQTPPFSQSSITNFRKYITAEMINEINEALFNVVSKDTGSQECDDDKGGGGDDNAGTGPGGSDIESDPPDNCDAEVTRPANKGIMLLDATCAPANITYPTDVNLLNEAREKLEGIIDSLWPPGYNGKKPRTYRINARKAYLSFIKRRKPNVKTIRKAIKQQLGYVKRNLGHVDKMLQRFGDRWLSNRQREWLPTIRTLYSQQKQMYETKKHSVENRIVSIGQPHVRPIVRGKTTASVEFGAKVSINMIDGYAFVDKIGWDAYNEESLLIPAIERYKERHGHYPEAVLVDRIYRNRENRAFCKLHGIRISGPRLGRPPMETDCAVIKQERIDASGRNAIEGKFGEGKMSFGLDRIMARLKCNSETVIALSFFCMNINRKLRVLLRYFLCWYSFFYDWVFG